MKMRTIAGTAALLAAAAAGSIGYLGRGPGDVALKDEVTAELVAAPAVTVTPEPPPVATTTPESMAGCGGGERIVRREELGIAGLVGDPSGGYMIVRDGSPPIALPPGAIDDRVVDYMKIFKRAGEQDLYANVEVALYDGEDGRLKDYRQLPNMIVNGGKNLGITMLIGSNATPGVNVTPCPVASCGNSGLCNTPAKFNWVGIGASGTDEAADQSALLGEFTIGSLYARQQDTFPDFPGTAGQAKLIVTFGADNPDCGTSCSSSVLESGLFNASSSGGSTIMLARRKFGTITKGDQDTLQITWTCTLG